MIRAAFTLLMLVGFVQSATAETKNVTATETPWTVACQAASADGKIACEMTKELRTFNPASLVAQLSVLTTAEGQSMRVIVPHHLAITEGIELLIDDKDAGRKQFTTSVPAGIVALFALDESTLDAARAGEKLKIAAKLRTGQDFSIIISLAGFSAALDKLLQ